MSPYEILNLLVALIGAVTGLTSLMRTRRIAKKQLEFQAITAALAKRQLQVLERQENAESKADVTVELVKVGRTDFRFVLSNSGSHPPPTSTSVSRRTVPTTHSLATRASGSCRIQSSSQGNRLH